LRRNETPKALGRGYGVCPLILLMTAADLYLTQLSKTFYQMILKFLSSVQ
jgi:hypothetical protein